MGVFETHSTMMYLDQKKLKIGRNDPCPCGSGRKYKKCCLAAGKPGPAQSTEAQYFTKYKIRLKKASDIEAIRKAGRLVLKTLDLAESTIRPGITTGEIDTLTHEYTLAHGATPAPLNYRGFPKSCCISVNEVICHGIPGKRVLQEGDIVNVDITSILDGYFADANKTFFVGSPNADARKIVSVARKSLQVGMEMVRPGRAIGDIGWAIQQYAEKEGCSVVREFVGHGVGFAFHEAPQIPHYGNRGEGVMLVPGMVFTIEPMINLGKKDLKVLKDKWTAVTRDNSLSAQFEQTVLVTETGFESMTPYE